MQLTVMGDSDRKDVLDKASQLTHDDRQLVDLVSAVLVDPNLHTDLRMRLQRELTALLHDTRRQTSQKPSVAARESATAERHHHPVDLLTSVLVDPNLHTDLRMRLYHQIHELLDGAHTAGTGARPDGPQKEQQ